MELQAEEMSVHSTRSPGLYTDNIFSPCEWVCFSFTSHTEELFLYIYGSMVVYFYIYIFEQLYILHHVFVEIIAVSSSLGVSLDHLLF